MRRETVSDIVSLLLDTDDSANEIVKDAVAYGIKNLNIKGVIYGKHIDKVKSPYC